MLNQNIQLILRIVLSKERAHFTKYRPQVRFHILEPNELHVLAFLTPEFADVIKHRSIDKITTKEAV